MALAFVLVASSAAAQTTSGADCPEDRGFFGGLIDTLKDIFGITDPPPAPKITGKEFVDQIFPKLLTDADPYGYKGDTGDGCYARAYSICYDISTGKLGTLPAGCSLQTVFVFWKNKPWVYHTACSVKCADGEYVLDGLNGKPLTTKEWFSDWAANNGEETKTGVRYGPYDDDGTPTQAERDAAQRIIEEQNKKAGR